MEVKQKQKGSLSVIHMIKTEIETHLCGEDQTFFVKVKMVYYYFMLHTFCFFVFFLHKYELNAT